MTPTWTGKAGEPVPAILRHDLTPCGERQRRCTRCGGYWWLDEPPREGDLCPVAVAQRLAEVERDRDDAIVRLGRLVQTDVQRLAEVDLIRREMRDGVDAVDSMSTRLYQRTAEVERLTREMESIRVRSTEACKGTGLSPANAGIVPEIVAILAARLRASAARVAELEAHVVSPAPVGADAGREPGSKDPR